MPASKCCHAKVSIKGQTTRYYICNNCGEPCDVCDDINNKCKRCNKNADPLQQMGANLDIEISDTVTLQILLCAECLKYLLKRQIDDEMDYDTRMAYIHYATNGLISPS